MSGGRSCRGKRRFRDAQEAKQTLRYIRGKSARQVIPVRYYECRRCGGFHLTSKPMR